MRGISGLFALAVAAGVSNAQKIDATAWQLVVSNITGPNTYPYQYGVMFEVCTLYEHLGPLLRPAGHQSQW